MQAVDQLGLNWLHGWGLAWPNLVLVLGSYLPWLLILGALVYLVFMTRERGYGERLLHVGGATVAAWVVATILKSIIRRLRPFLLLPDLHQLINVGEKFSLPSSHAASLIALALALRRHYPTLGSWYVVAAVVVGTARVAAGVHWPSDIVVGLIVGAVVEATLAGLVRFRLYYASK